jgi:hypothetical protein
MNLMKFKRIETSKFSSKRKRLRTKNKPLMYYPSALKAAGQHIDTEDLPDHLRRRPIAQGADSTGVSYGTGAWVRRG